MLYHRGTKHYELCELQDERSKKSVHKVNHVEYEASE